MFSSNWIVTTKQTWKVIVFSGIAALALELLYFSLKNDQYVMVIAALLLFIAGLAWFAYSVRCPHCSYKIAKHQLFHGRYFIFWFIEMVFLTKCPSCGKDLSQK